MLCKTVENRKNRKTKKVKWTFVLQQTAESAVMFTRLDSERNAKIMKKAVNDSKLDPGRYKVSNSIYISLSAFGKDGCFCAAFAE